MEDKVDIILTTYNSNIKYLRKQIESILNQTYKNITLIISDDCSTNEDVRTVLSEYKEKDSRIILYFQEKNIGYNKNFEFLLKKTTSDYISFSDHDDIWYPNKIERCLNKLKLDNVDMVYCNCKQIDEEENIIQEDYFKYKNVPLVQGKNKIAISRCVGIGCSQLITKKVKDRMIPFKENVIAHDWLSAFIANEEKGISYIKEPLFSYRLHSQNVFGGRSLSQNINRWKIEHREGYNSYLEYRKDAIKRAYLGGILMCMQYTKDEKNKQFIQQAKEYYNNILKSKKINIHIIKYFKILYGRNQGKKMIREIALFHFAIISYIKFKNIKGGFINGKG